MVFYAFRGSANEKEMVTVSFLFISDQKVLLPDKSYLPAEARLFM